MSAVAQTPTLLPLDHPQLNGIGDTKLIYEIRQELFKSLPAIQRDINLAIGQHDWQTARNLLHRLLGTCAYCGAPRLQVAAENVRAIIRKDATQLSQLMLNEFNEVVDMTLQAVAK